MFAQFPLVGASLKSADPVLHAFLHGVVVPDVLAVESTPEFVSIEFWDMLPA